MQKSQETTAEAKAKGGTNGAGDKMGKRGKPSSPYNDDAQDRSGAKRFDRSGGNSFGRPGGKAEAKPYGKPKGPNKR